LSDQLAPAAQRPTPFRAPPTFRLLLISYSPFLGLLRGRVNLRKNRTISPEKIVRSCILCPWDPFRKPELEGGADKRVDGQPTKFGCWRKGGLRGCEYWGSGRGEESVRALVCA
jgi:hypothetical protein